MGLKSNCIVTAEMRYFASSKQFMFRWDKEKWYER